MSDGYTALDEARFQTARKAFRQAAQLRADSGEASSALQEVEVAETAHRLAELKDVGVRSESSEQWQAAVEAYEEAAAIDPNVLYVREGLERARDRARLDKQFRTAIEDPMRLSDVAVAEATAVLLARAEELKPRGPVLDEQISKLQRLLEQANTPISVILQSDRETEVIVYKVARLGRFDRQQLTLRPGTYTAVGTRLGYRDVRTTFTLSHDNPIAPVTVACTEQI